VLQASTVFEPLQAWTCTV